MTLRLIQSVSLWLLSITAAVVVADPAAHVDSTSRERAAEIMSLGWWQVVESEVPPLRNALGERWPMIMWHGPGSAPLEPEQVRFLLDRGLTQHVPLDTGYIEAATRLHAAGSKVIIMQGEAGNWPYSLAPDSSEWAHQFDEGYHYKDAGPGPLGEWQGACVLQHAGWAVLADNVRDTLTAFRTAGVMVDGVFMDWEGDPYPFINLFGQLAHCRRCREQLPPAVLTDKKAWWDYYWRAYMQLHGSYVAAPAREIFPQVAVTNWFVVYSSQNAPHPYFVDDRILPPLAPPMFSATNPVAYGNDLWFSKEWQNEWPLDRRHVDQFYMHNLLRGVSIDAVNRRAYGPEVMSFPWVTRFCPLKGESGNEMPDMSRSAYREALRHMWLRDIDGMQVFNAEWGGFEETWVWELQDAVSVYDEILAHGEFLEVGEAMNLEVPARQDDGVLWSGLRLSDRALVRAVSQGPESAQVEIPAWEDVRVTLEAPTAGATYLVERSSGAVVEVE